MTILFIKVVQEIIIHKLMIYAFKENKNKTKKANNKFFSSLN
jgi:hypothetical protein